MIVFSEVTKVAIFSEDDDSLILDVLKNITWF